MCVLVTTAVAAADDDVDDDGYDGVRGETAS